MNDSVEKSRLGFEDIGFCYWMNQQQAVMMMLKKKKTTSAFVKSSDPSLQEKMVREFEEWEHPTCDEQRFHKQTGDLKVSWQLGALQDR